MMKFFLPLALTTISTLVLAVTQTTAGEFKPCCRDGSSPYASESRDTLKSNSRAGYIGSELPPSSGYNPDHLDKYSNPENKVQSEPHSIYNNRQRGSTYGEATTEYGGKATTVRPLGDLGGSFGTELRGY